jgi:hypothetical protein
MVDTIHNTIIGLSSNGFMGNICSVFLARIIDIFLIVLIIPMPAIVLSSLHYSYLKLQCTSKVGELNGIYDCIAIKTR